MNKSRLMDISIKISSGLTPLRSNPEFWESPDIPWVKTEQLGIKHIYDSNEKISKAALEKTTLKVNPPNTISIAMYGEGRTRGNLSILKNEVTTNQACCNIVVDEKKAHYEYVYYFLKNQYNQLRSLSSGVRKNLNSNDIKYFPIMLPNRLVDQFEIARVLSNLDAKIELNNKINAELEAMAKLIYDYWFVQFDFPDANGKPYKSSGGKMVYNEALKREIPAGWVVGKLGEYAQVKKGELITKKTSEKGAVKVVAAGIEFSYFHSEANCKENTITVSGSGASAGYINFWREPIFASDCITIRGSSDAETLLILGYLKTIQGYIFKQARGSAQPHVYPDDISRLMYLKPPGSIIEKFGINILASNKKIATNKIENEMLIELRDWLLPMLMNGQVTMNDA